MQPRLKNKIAEGWWEDDSVNDTVEEAYKKNVDRERADKGLPFSGGDQPGMEYQQIDAKTKLPINTDDSANRWVRGRMGDVLKKMLQDIYPDQDPDQKTEVPKEPAVREFEPFLPTDMPADKAPKERLVDLQGGRAPNWPTVSRGKESSTTPAEEELAKFDRPGADTEIKKELDETGKRIQVEHQHTAGKLRQIRKSLGLNEDGSGEKTN